VPARAELPQLFVAKRLFAADIAPALLFSTRASGQATATVP